MRARRVRTLGAHVVAVVVATAAHAGGAAAQGDVDDLAYYVGIVEQAKGHLLASREVYGHWRHLRGAPR